MKTHNAVFDTGCIRTFVSTRVASSHWRLGNKISFNFIANGMIGIYQSWSLAKSVWKINKRFKRRIWFHIFSGSKWHSKYFFRVYIWCIYNSQNFMLYFRLYKYYTLVIEFYWYNFLYVKWWEKCETSEFKLVSN